MAELAGHVGDIRTKASLVARTISFVNNGGGQDYFLDSAAGFVSAGFTASMLLTLSGAAAGTNNGSFTAATVHAGGATITVSAAQTLQTASAGAEITVVERTPGTQLGGYFNWRLTYEIDTLDVTDFGDGDTRAYLATIKDWTATAEKHWVTGAANQYNQDSWMGKEKVVRFFTRYDAAASTTNAYYYEGHAIISGIDITTDVNTVVTEPVTFKGTGPLTFNTRSTAWDT